MAKASTTVVANETFVSATAESYEKHDTYPASEPAETSQRRKTGDEKYLRVQRAANRGSESVSVTVHAGVGQRTKKRIVRANRRLA